MKSFIKNTIVFILLYLVTSCSKDFLNENLTQDSLPVGLSNIYISPDWKSSNYLFKLPSVKESDYEIVSKPSWLNIGFVSGHLSDSLAIVQCSATKNSDFNTVGIYMDFMTVKAGGKSYKVPVAYITEGYPTVQIQSTLTLSSNTYGYPNLLIQNTGLGILLWEISSLPDWLVLDTARLESNGIYISPYASYNIPLRFKLDEVSSMSLTGEIVLSTNDKQHPSVTINVVADLGTPHLSIYPNTINFSFTETLQTLTLDNYGDGTLIWEFKDIPEWLSITPLNGICNSYSSSSNIIFSCDRTKLPPGQNSSTVILRTNDSSHPAYSIKVIANASGISENIREIDGSIIDAVFDKNTNILYYVTSSPNKFIAYDVVDRIVLNEISLSKAPTSFAISEDWAKSAVGHNGFISAIDLSSNTVTEVYSLDYSVNDIAWAENDWFCYTQNGGSFSNLHWINTANGTLYDSTDQYFGLDGSSIVKKVPNQAYLIATQNGSSPSGFFAYDIATKSKKSYAHMDLYNFWFSENGDYIFGKDLNVYRTTSSTGSDSFEATINAIDIIKTGNEDFIRMHHLYHSNNYLWVLLNNSYSSDEYTSIYQIEDNDYTLVKKYDYDQFYQPDAQTTPYDISANYVFVNKEGTEIAVLCKGVSNNSWIIQFIPVN
jgi:hypothetical protein